MLNRGEARKHLTEDSRPFTELVSSTDPLEPHRNGSPRPYNPRNALCSPTILEKTSNPHFPESHTHVPQCVNAFCSNIGLCESKMPLETRTKRNRKLLRETPSCLTSAPSAQTSWPLRPLTPSHQQSMRALLVVSPLGSRVVRTSISHQPTELQSQPEYRSPER